MCYEIRSNKQQSSDSSIVLTAKLIGVNIDGSVPIMMLCYPRIICKKIFV